MSNPTDRRRVARLTVPRRFRGGELELQLVHVLDLSLLGARIAHREPLHVGGIGYVDLPPALGRIRLLGRVAWTRLRATEQTLNGDRQALYESGLEFTSLTAEQQMALADALEKLQAPQTGPEQGPSA